MDLGEALEVLDLWEVLKVLVYIYLPDVMSLMVCFGRGVEYDGFVEGILGFGFPVVSKNWSSHFLIMYIFT